LHGLLGLATFADLESHPKVGFDLENPADQARLAEPLLALESLGGLIVIAVPLEQIFEDGEFFVAVDHLSEVYLEKSVVATDFSRWPIGDGEREKAGRLPPRRVSNFQTTVTAGWLAGASLLPRETAPSSFHLAQGNNCAGGTEQLVERHAGEGFLRLGVDLVELAMQRAEPGVRRQAKWAATDSL
jgi:hypothetical protein